MEGVDFIQTYQMYPRVQLGIIQTTMAMSKAITARFMALCQFRRRLHVSAVDVVHAEVAALYKHVHKRGFDAFHSMKNMLKRTNQCTEN